MRPYTVHFIDAFGIPDTDTMHAVNEFDAVRLWVFSNQHKANLATIIKVTN